MAELKNIKDDLAILLARTEGLSELKCSVNDLTAKVENIEKKLTDEFLVLQTRMSELEKSQQFISEEFEKQKFVTNRLVTKKSQIENENKILNSRLTS